MTSGRFWVKQKKRTRTGPPRAAVLCRQSILKADSISLEDQEQRARAYAEERGYAVVDAYHSPGIKGWHEDRADHAHFVELARANEIDVVIGYDVFRVARTMRLMEEFAHALETEGVRLEFSSQPMANEPLGRQMITMLAEFETAARSVKAADTWDALRRARHRWHGKAPYGYRREARTIAVDERERDTALRILMWGLEGKSSVWIRDALIAEGVPTRLGGQWHESMIWRMLRNPVYAGGLRIGDEVLWPDPTAWEPLIDRDTWERLQALLPRAPHVRRKPVSSWTEGHVRHACGQRMYLMLSATPHGDIPVYVCKNRYRPERCRGMHGQVSATNLATAAREAIASARFAVAPLAVPPDDEPVRLARAGIAARRRAIAQERAALDAMLQSGRRSIRWWTDEDDKLNARERALEAEAAEIGAPAIDPAEVASRLAAVNAALALAADSDVADAALAALLLATGMTLVVGEGGVRLALPPDMAPHAAPSAPVKIPRARTR